MRFVHLCNIDKEERENNMRKLIIATTISLILAGTASAADGRGNGESQMRGRETPIVRFLKLVKRIIVPTDLPVVPFP